MASEYTTPVADNISKEITPAADNIPDAIKDLIMKEVGVREIIYLDTSNSQKLAARKAAWIEVARAVGKTPEVCKSVYENRRSSFLRHLKSKYVKSEKDVSTYHQHTMFLYPILKQVKSTQKGSSSAASAAVASVAAENVTAIKDTEKRADQVLSTFISHLLSGVVESVRQQGYQVAFLASKCGGGGSNDILSLHGGLSLSIQKQLEVNFMNLITEAAQEADCSISQSGEETPQSYYNFNTATRDELAASSSHYDQASNISAGLESAACTDSTMEEYSSDIDPSLTGYADYSPTTDGYYADLPVDYDDDQILDESPHLVLQIKTEPPNDLQIEHDDTQIEPLPETEQTDSSAAAAKVSANPSEEDLQGRKKNKYHNSSSRYQSKRIYHMRKLTGEKPYACSECPYRSASQANVKKHILTHTGEKPYACPKCPYRCSRRSNLKQHVQTHTREKLFACPFCAFRSAHRQSVTRHAQTHFRENQLLDETIQEDCTFDTDASLTGDAEYSPATDNDAGASVEYNDGITLVDGEKQQMQIKREPPNDL